MSVLFLASLLFYSGLPFEQYAHHSDGRGTNYIEYRNVDESLPDSGLFLYAALGTAPLTVAPSPARYNDEPLDVPLVWPAEETARTTFYPSAGAVVLPWWKEAFRGPDCDTPAPGPDTAVPEAGTLAMIVVGSLLLTLFKEKLCQFQRK